MTGGSLLRRAKKVFSRGESSRASESPSTPVQSLVVEDFESIGSQQPPRHSLCPTAHDTDDGVRLINQHGVPIRRRGRTTCADLQSLPEGTRVSIEINENNVPCNIVESTLLGSYLGVIARDPILAPISFSDWRNKGLDPFKKKKLLDVEAKFIFPGQLRIWILQNLGVKWRNYKTNLKAEYWDSRPLEEIMENVPPGVDAAQWCQLVSQWATPEDQERAAKNSANAKKQKCPHLMGRVSSVRRQKETSIKDRLQLWRINRIRKDGSWSSDEAKFRWEKACELLAEEGVNPEDGNVEANERVFNLVMGPEHPGRVRTQGFGVTPSRYFSKNITTEGASTSGSSSANYVSFDELASFKSEVKSDMREFMQEMRTLLQPPRSSQSEGNDHTSED